MHYKNGRPAQINDPVVGATYNRKGIQVGILVGITEGAATCNALVLLLDVKPPEKRELSLITPELYYTQVDHLYHAADAYATIEAALIPRVAAWEPDCVRDAATGQKPVASEAETR